MSADDALPMWEKGTNTQRSWLYILISPESVLNVHEFLSSDAREPNISPRVYTVGERVVQDPPSAMTEERAQAAQEAQEESAARQEERKRFYAEARERSRGYDREHGLRLSERWRRERQQREEEFRAFKKRGGWR